MDNDANSNNGVANQDYGEEDDNQELNEEESKSAFHLALPNLP